MQTLKFKLKVLTYSMDVAKNSSLLFMRMVKSKSLCFLRSKIYLWN
jgi:hypothetical protein